MASKCGVLCGIAPQVSLTSCVEFIIDALANVKIYNGYVMVIASQFSLGVEMCTVFCAEIQFIAELVFLILGELSFLPLYIYIVSQKKKSMKQAPVGVTVTQIQKVSQ